MKKTYFIILLSVLSLTSCADNNNVYQSDQAKEENIIFNWWNDRNTFNNAKISDNKNYEATEEVEVSTWESATITSFGSWESNENNSWATN